MDESTELPLESEGPEAELAVELDQIEAILNGTAEMPEQQADAPETEEAAAAPEKAIDYELDIPMPDGAEPVKLGALKDFYQQASQHKLSMIEAEQALATKRAEAETLLSYVQHMPPEVQRLAMEQQREDFNQNMARLNELLPETKSEAGLHRLKDQVVGLVKEYGKSAAWVDRIMDADSLKMLRDFAELKATIKAAKDNVKPLRTDQTRPAANAKKAAPRPNDKWAAIDQVLRSR